VKVGISRHRLALPFPKVLLKGIDITKGGAWFTTYALFWPGRCDRWVVIDRLIFREKEGDLGCLAAGSHPLKSKLEKL